MKDAKGRTEWLADRHLVADGDPCPGASDSAEHDLFFRLFESATALGVPIADLPARAVEALTLMEGERRHIESAQQLETLNG